MYYCKAKIKVGDQEYSCNSKAGPNDYCILHDDDPNKDKKDFIIAVRDIIYNPAIDPSRLRGTVFNTTDGLFNKNISNRLILDGATFNCDVEIKNIHIQNTSSFRNVTFNGKFNCRDLNIIERCEFDDVNFNGKTLMHNVQFHSGVYFNKMECSDEICFDNVQFNKGNCVYSDCVFHSDSSFKKVACSDVLKYSNVEFYGILVLEDCHMRKGLEMDNVYCYSESMFRDIHVSFRMLFNMCTLSGEASFPVTNLPSETYFINVSFLGNTDFDKEYNIGPKNLIFKNCNMQGVYMKTLPFLNGDSVEIQDCKWPKKGRIRRRHIINDENRAEEYDLVKRIYRKLHEHYYKLSDFRLASDFYIGFLTANRKASNIPFPARMLNWLYGVFAQYGESYTRPFLAILVMWFIAPLLLLLMGVQLDPNMGEVKYTLALGLDDFILLTTDYWKTFIYNISLSTLFRGAELRPHITSWPHALICIETLLNAVFVSFMVVGIRRQFVPKKPV
ncbi:MAG: hypothetical protein JW763_01375 [candidate division Zixibacteria bacterium]|nr:hypothetical protein [candidate division Zixibacteria bacterium]